MKKTLSKPNANKVKPLLNWPDLVFITLFGWLFWTNVILLIDNLFNKG